MSFYVRIRGRVHGPMDVAKLQSLAAKGQLSRIHEISQDQQSWQPASTMPELFAPAAMGSPAASGNAAATPDAGNPAHSIQSTMVEPAGGAPANPSGSITSTAIEQPGVSMQPSSMGDPGMAGGHFGAGSGGNAFASSNHDQWYYAIDGNQAGPLTMATLLQLVQNGSVNAHDMVWKEGMGDWREVENVPELAASLSTTASAGSLEIAAGSGSAEGHLIAAVPWIRLVMIGVFLMSVLWGLCSIAMMVLSIMASQVVLLIAWLVNLIMAGLLLHFGIVLVGLLGQCRMLRQSPSSSSLTMALSQTRLAWKSLAIFITVVLSVTFMVAGLIVMIVALGADLGGLAPVLPF